MQQFDYFNQERDSMNYSRGFDDGYYQGKQEGRREALEEFKALLKGLEHDSKRVSSND